MSRGREHLEAREEILAGSSREPGRVTMSMVDGRRVSCPVHAVSYSRPISLLSIERSG